MKLRNKKTGEIVRVEFLSNWQTDDGTEIGFRECNTNIVYTYTSLAELNEEWEDYDEPKGYWYIRDGGNIDHNLYGKSIINRHKEIGNYFESKEEAEKAVKKLKAWKRLKDKGFRFTGVYDDYTIKFTAPKEEIGWFWCNGMDKDLDLLFGGEE